jgi:hypothetical protein
MSKRAIGYDPGTMFCQTAEMDGEKVKFTSTRNAFVELPQSDDVEETLKRNNWQYIKDDGRYYVVGEDCIKVANIFPGKVEVRRPMADGVLNKNEDKKLVILAEIVRSSIGYAPTPDSLVCICVSSESVDSSVDSTFHKNRLTALFTRLGWKVKVIEEAHAVILSERPVITEEDGTVVPYSGIGVSFGAGRANCLLAYKGLPVIGMSVARSGDWIDKQVSEQTGVAISQVISAKEKKLDFSNLDDSDDVIFALDSYYDAMIEHVFKHFSKKFQEVKSQFTQPLEIVVAGGTSTPKGFCAKLENIIKGLDLPFKVKNVRHAKNPRNAVVEGLLTQAIITQKKDAQVASQDQYTVDKLLS